MSQDPIHVELMPSVDRRKVSVLFESEHPIAMKTLIECMKTFAQTMEDRMNINQANEAKGRLHRVQTNLIEPT